MERNHVTVALCIPCGRWTYSNIAYSVDFVPRTDINLLNQHLALNFRIPTSQSRRWRMTRCCLPSTWRILEVPEILSMTLNVIHIGANGDIR